jgi:hypothetical protein
MQAFQHLQMNGPQLQLAYMDTQRRNDIHAMKYKKNIEELGPRDLYVCIMIISQARPFSSFNLISRSCSFDYLYMWSLEYLSRHSMIDIIVLRFAILYRHSI